MLNLEKIYFTDQFAVTEWERLLTREGIVRDPNLEYAVGLYTDGGKLVATGACMGNTLRCIAVSGEYRGCGLTNRLVTHLTEYLNARGVYHIFLYTKCETAPLFADLGFHCIATVDGKLAFMENRADGFSRYLSNLKRGHGRQAAVVMNANPFTNGHRHLVECAAKACDSLHLFVVSEDRSAVPFSVRYRLVQEGTADICNIIYHKTGSYIISQATFPSYFLKKEDCVTEVQAETDAAVFSRIALELGIDRRFVGDEPYSELMEKYNRTLHRVLPGRGIEVTEIPRLSYKGSFVSATTIRSLLRSGNLKAVSFMVPQSTYRYFTSSQAVPVLERIRNAVH